MFSRGRSFAVFQKRVPRSPSAEVSTFIAGVQKGGTSSLYAYFQQHPGMQAPVRKEIHFFDDESIDWSAPNYSRLHDHFRPETAGRRRFDATPIYSFWPPALARIRAYNPEARLVFLFRDPFERAYSHWCMEYARGAEPLSFAECLRDGRRRIEESSPLDPARRAHSYVERGHYAEQVERAQGLFPPSQLLFLKSEDLQERRMDTLQRIARFLAIDPFADCGARRENSRPQVSYPAAPTPQDLQLVRHELAQDLQRFAELTGLDISSWPTCKES